MAAHAEKRSDDRIPLTRGLQTLALDEVRKGSFLLFDEVLVDLLVGFHGRHG